LRAACVRLRATIDPIPGPGRAARIVRGDIRFDELR
jgi:hypothetical protein